MDSEMTKNKIYAADMHRVEGAVLTCQDVGYSVDVRPPDKLFGKKSPKHILKHVDGLFKPGVNAILGPTGSGKTSLLDVLAGRKNPNGLKGTVLVDGGPQPKNFKCMTGYVVQDDVVMGTLTVRENFMFSANVRLPSTVSKKAKEQKVDEVIDQLGLTHCADTKVGTEFIRGVSGGERKRTNIGMELIVSQSVLFLDEPTTGLDASTANAVIGLLKELADKGTTVIFSIHQPRYSIYKMFDNLVLLSLGRVVYHGPAMQALDFFNTQGYECEAHNNPPDFFLDVINGDSTAVQSYPDNAKMNGESKVHMSGEIVEIQQTEDRLSEKLHDAYIKSPWNQQITEDIQKEIEKGARNLSVASRTGDYATSLFTQFHYVSIRTLKNSFRNPQTTIAQIFVMVLFALITGIIYLQVGEMLPGAIQNRVGAFFFIIMNMIFGNLSAVELFIQERKIFVHENSSGFYSALPYFLGKILCDVIPLRCVPVMVFASIVYFMIGLVPEADKFFIFMLNLVLTTLSASAVGFFVSASVKLFAIANLLIALIYVFMMVFGGLLVNIESIWVGIRWLQYLSIFKYSLYTLLINEMKGLEFYSEVTINGTTQEVSVGNAGEDYMDDLGIEYETAWDLWSNQVAIMGLTIGFLLLAYIQLRRIPTWK